MPTETAFVGLWARHEEGDLVVRLGTADDSDESAPLGHLPRTEAYYLDCLRAFVGKHTDLGDPQEVESEPTLIGEFTITGSGDVLSYTLHLS